MDGVERIMVLGIFAVIVAILSIAAWGVTDDDGSVLDGGDGGLAITGPSVVTSVPDERVAHADDGQRTPGSSGSRVAGGGAPSTGKPEPGVRNPKTPSGPVVVQRPNGGGRSSRPDRGTTPRTPVDPPRNLSLKTNVTTGGPAAGGDKPAAPAAKPGFVQHKVAKGDTVWTIVRGHFGSGDIKAQLKLVAQLNPAIDLDQVKPGDVLKLPVEVPEDVVTKPISQQAKAGTRLYTIGAGETLTQIAEEQLGDGKLANDIYQLNRKTIAHPDKVFEGMTILLPVR